jgi:hypothetical protein
MQSVKQRALGRAYGCASTKSRDVGIKRLEVLHAVRDSDYIPVGKYSLDRS